MITTKLRIGPWKLYVVEPHDWSYGHLALEVLINLKIASQERAVIFFDVPRHAVNRVLINLDCTQVRILVQDAWYSVAVRMLGRLARALEGVSPWWKEFRRIAANDWGRWKTALHRRFNQEFRRQAKRYLSSSGAAKHSIDVRNELVARLKDDYQLDLRYEDIQASPPRRDPEHKTYYRRALLREPMRVTLRHADAQVAEEIASRLGIEKSARIVTLHVRESGFKTMGGRSEALVDVVRNANIENYFDAVDMLVERGFTVVRIGDVHMTPVRRRGLIDLATSPLRSENVELWCLMRSHFFLGCDSGPHAVCLLFNTPSLLTNVPNPLGTFPIRRHSMYILKHVVDVRMGRSLSLREILSESYLANFRNPVYYRYIENTPREIVEAVGEMLACLDRLPDETPSQREYRELVQRRTRELSSIRYIQKWGMEDDGFLGEGRIARCFVEKYFDRGVELGTDSRIAGPVCDVNVKPGS